MSETRVAVGQCFHCRFLDMRPEAGGRFVYWCERRKSDLTESWVWKRRCRHYIAAVKPMT